MNDPEFYVGYQPNAPPGLARRTRRAVTLLAMLGIALAALLAAAQGRFEPSLFEFQQVREYEGLFSSWPYPVLSVNEADYLLVGEGKHGVDAGLLPRDADGRWVRLRGTLAQNGSARILELLPGSFQAVPAPTAQARRGIVVRGGMVKLAGEIVDTKCHFGVMNPGKGKVHRDCAARCLSGGIPPGLLVRDASGAARVFILSAPAGGLNKQLLDYVAEPVTVTGEAIRSGSLWILEIGSANAIQRE